MQLLLLVYTSLPEQTQRDATICATAFSYLRTIPFPYTHQLLPIYTS